MIQTGDPSGSGKGGQSIWGKPFPDEIRSTLKVCCFLFGMCFRCLQVFLCKFSTVQQPGDSGYGERWPRHEQVPVLRHVCETTASRRQVYNLWKGSVWSVVPSYGRRTDPLCPQVIDGLDTLDAMERVPVNAKNRPLNEKITLTHVRTRLPSILPINNHAVQEIKAASRFRTRRSVLTGFS